MTAQNKLYKKVVLFTPQSADIFVQTLRKYELGYLVKTIDVYNWMRRPNFTQKLLLPLSHLCPNIKNLITKQCPEDVFWQCIQIERSEGYFSKLQLVPLPGTTKKELTVYYKAAYSLRETLDTLFMFTKRLALARDLEHFTNINTLYFKLYDCADMFIIDRQIKRCSSARSIVVNDYVQNSTAETIRNTEARSSIHICSQIKQLVIKPIAFQSGLCGYLMKVFPCLNELKLDFTFKLNPRLPLSNTSYNITAFQFILYIMKMERARVNYVPVEDLADLMMNLQAIKNDVNKHLNIQNIARKKNDKCII